jgi:N-acetylgalactosamine PTS system EIIA component
MTNSDTPAGEPPPEEAPPEPAARPATPALVLGHAEYAAGLVSAVDAITGRGELLIPISNRDAAVDEIERRIADAADATGARVVFTDLPAGSCTFAARRLIRTRPDMVVVTGVTLPALLDYVFHAELPPAEAADHVAEMARKAIAVVRGAAVGAPSQPPVASGGPRAG